MLFAITIATILSYCIFLIGKKYCNDKSTDINQVNQADRVGEILRAQDAKFTIGYSSTLDRPFAQVQSSKGSVIFKYNLDNDGSFQQEAVSRAKQALRSKLAAKDISLTKEDRVLAARIQSAVFACFDYQGYISMAPDGKVQIDNIKYPLRQVRVSVETFQRLCPDEFAIAQDNAGSLSNRQD